MSDTVTIALRFALYIDLMLMFGLPLFGLYGLRGPERAANTVLRFRALVAATAVVGLLLSVAGIVSLAAAMSGAPLTEVNGAAVNAIVSGTTIGTVWLVRMAALLLIAVIAVMGRGGSALWLGSTAGLAGVAVATLAWSGHGAMSDGAIGSVHLAADIVHLLAAGAWLGALLALAVLLFRPTDRMTPDHLRLAHRALSGFAIVGTVLVSLLIVTGLINSWMIISPDNLPALVTTRYGWLLLAKLLLFAAMLGLAAINRFRLAPSLNTALETSDHPSAVSALRLSLGLETACAVFILALVAWLGTLAPPSAGV